jgi:transposase
MSMSKRRTQHQQELWVCTTDIVTPAGHPFYQALNRLLEQHAFDAFVEDRCESFYAVKRGRPSIPPGVYFRMLLIGYFEGIDSERGTACVPGLRSESEDAGPFESFGHPRAARPRYAS